MFKWPVLFLWFGNVLCATSQTIKYADSRVINTAGPEYAFQQQLYPADSSGLTQYSKFVSSPPQESTLEQPKNVRAIIVTKKVPIPYPVQVEKKVPVPVKVPIRRPYAVYVPKPYYVEVMKQVPVPVKVPVPQPYTVEKHVPFPFKVHYDKPFPVHITRPYPVYYEKRVPLQVEKPVAVPYKVQVDRPMPVQIPLERPVLYPVERPFHFPVKVPVEKPVASHVGKHIPVPVAMEKPPHAANEHALSSNLYTSTQATGHSAFTPSPYDALTSTLMSEEKHKVISFLPGSQNAYGTYTPNPSDVGTIHVSSIRDEGGNSTDWVPKAIPNNQYLTYIPNSHQAKYLQYTLPEKAPKLEPVSNAEPYIVNHGSVKMQYKLHYDPTKQEYSFQLVPKTPVSDPTPASYSYQPSNADSNQELSSLQTEYVYKTPGTQNSESYRYPAKSPENGVTYTYEQVYQNKPDESPTQPSSESPVLTYSYHSEEQMPINYRPSGSFEGSRQVAPQLPQVTYSYSQPAESQSHRLQQISADQHQATYSYENPESSSKVTYETQMKESHTYPEQVRYMYFPHQSTHHSYPQADTSHQEAHYSVSHGQNEVHTEYPKILYQQGRVTTILRDNYVTQVPDGGRIPENLKTSRTTESLSFLTPRNESRNSPDSSKYRDEANEMSTTTTDGNNNYYVLNVHPTMTNETLDDPPTSSIKFEKFSVADVMGPRTKLYPVNSSTESQTRRMTEYSTSTSERPQTTDAVGIQLENYFQESETSAITDVPFSTKVYRLSSYKVPGTRRASKAKHRKATTTPAPQNQENTQSYENEETKTTTAPSTEWYKFFSGDDFQYPKNPVKETNSHTGAAERAPFFGESSSSATTTTRNSLQPPDEAITVMPTQSLRTRNRGSVRAYRRKSDGPTTEANNSTITTTRTRRRRRPARRRMDQVTEPTVEESTT